MDVSIERNLVKREPTRSLLPLTWSDSKLEGLRRTSLKDQPIKDSIQPPLAEALLEFAAGEPEQAEAKILTLFRENAPRCLRIGPACVAMLQALFVIQRFDLLADMLKEVHGFPGELSIEVEDTDRSPACLRWDVSSAGRQNFSFSAKLFQDDSTTHRIQHLHWLLPMLCNYAAQEVYEAGSVLINQADLGVMPGLAFSDSRPDYFLVPDQIFIPTRGYRHYRKVLAANAVSWVSRKPQALWRGSTTGIKAGPRDWQSLERIKLCQIAQRHADSGLIDAGISRVAQFKDTCGIADEIRAAGLLKGFIPWQGWGQYKYLIDIDGNSSPFSNLFQRLLTGSTVVKVESSRGLRQWYYDELVPWKNYVPIAPDMSDLIDKLAWLERHDGFAERIGRQGFELAERLSYEHELQRSIPVIAAAFRYFNGRERHVAAYGKLGA